MKKTYLLTPGPTPVPEAVSSVFAGPTLHHRTTAFEGILDSVKKDLMSLFQTKQEVLILASTGTGAMDAAVSNLFSPGEKVITINAGKFGARWSKISKAYGLNPIEIKLERGFPLEVQELKKTVQTHGDAKAILFQASETSTGLKLPTQEICQIAQEAGMLSVCDAITACGVFDLPMDRWGIDILITGSQKAMMIPPGLSFIALSDRAWKSVDSSKLPHFYFDLKKERESLAKNQSAWTPAISLIQGLQVALKMILEEGLQNTFLRHERLAGATRAGVHAMGLELLCKDSFSTAVTAVKVPGTIKNGKEIPKRMRTHYGVTIAGGQEELAGQIIRLSHFGYCGIFDITTGLSCLELVLNDLSHPVKYGTGVGAALNAYASSEPSGKV